MIEKFRVATNGKTISSASVKRLVGKNILTKIAPPGAVRGAYTIDSVDAYAEELRKFYSSIEVKGE
jgi:hypothetical protein